VNFLGLFNVLNSGREIVFVPVTVVINHSSGRSIDPQSSSPIMTEHRPINRDRHLLTLIIDEAGIRSHRVSLFLRTIRPVSGVSRTTTMTASDEMIFIEIATPALIR
jgi:hypothetical protein